MLVATRWSHHAGKRHSSVEYFTGVGVDALAVDDVQARD